MLEQLAPRLNLLDEQVACLFLGPLQLLDETSGDELLHGRVRELDERLLFRFPLLIFAFHESVSQQEVEGLVVLVTLDRVLVAMLEFLLVEVERGCKLLQLGVFNYLEVLLLFVGVLVLDLRRYCLDHFLVSHLNVSFVS